MEGDRWRRYGEATYAYQVEIRRSVDREGERNARKPGRREGSLGLGHWSFVDPLSIPFDAPRGRDRAASGPLAAPGSGRGWGTAPPDGEGLAIRSLAASREAWKKPRVTAHTRRAHAIPCTVIFGSPWAHQRFCAILTLRRRPLRAAELRS
jgi:hypothetical protein